MNRLVKTQLTPAQFAVDLGDGSERGLYVNQDYILRKLGRPHRAINIMYCYYPLDKEWPARVSEACRDADISFQWDYPYDDYFPYRGGLEGNTEGEPFTCMRDIRKHGQDVVLTLTCDPNVSDEHIIAIAKDLRNYGRMMLRLNHEATGDWFSFTKRTDYQGVADFFVRFVNIVKEYAPNVQTIICIGGIGPDGEQIEKEKEFAQTLKAADIWSIDQYLSLNWGWPYEVALKENSQHHRKDPKAIYDLTKRSFERFTYLNGGVRKPMLISEFNADGDVTGPFEQLNDVKKFCDFIKEDPDRWLSGFTFYQFRDDGRLGLEITDPNNSDVGVEQPILKYYKDMINEDFFKPGIEDKGECALPVRLRWGGSEDSEGLGIELSLEANPVFAEAYFEGSLADANLMMEINGQWFYKAPGVKYVDFMPAFFDSGIKEPKTVMLNIFAPPATGENDPSQGDDWQTNYYYEMKELPIIRLEFEPVIS